MAKKKEEMDEGKIESKTELLEDAFQEVFGFDQENGHRGKEPVTVEQLHQLLHVILNFQIIGE